MRCDGSNTDCNYRTSASEDWRCNSDVAWQWHGTWRERRGIHVFINFALSPERAGLFESRFWHRNVMLACFNNEACFHVASAIGCLHEHIYQHSTGRGTLDNSGLEFALRQCNQAISLLTSADEAEPDPDVALLTCILFTTFEALHGDSAQAIQHSLQGRTLLMNCERLQKLGRGSGLLETMHVRPIMGGLEIQAKSLQGRSMVKSDTRDEPPLPDVTRLHSLDHANWTLHYVYIALLVFCQDVQFDSEPHDLSVLMAEKYLTFVPWLKQWEEAFVDVLFREGSRLSQHDMERAKVLKANYLTSSILANLDLGLGRVAWAPYEKQCKTVIDLSASVLHHFCVGPQATMNSFHFPFLTFGLWVAEPLFMVMSRCTNPDYRRQAAGLLAGQKWGRGSAAKANGTWTNQYHPSTSLQSQHQQRRTLSCPASQAPGPPRHRGASSASVRSMPSTALALLANDVDNVEHGQAWEQDAVDTSDWTIDQWIDFVSSNRLDYGMAVYFGKFSPDSIEKPYYDARLHR